MVEMRWWRGTATGGGEDHGHAVLVHEEDDNRRTVAYRFDVAGPGRNEKKGRERWAAGEGREEKGHSRRRKEN